MTTLSAALHPVPLTSVAVLAAFLIYRRRHLEPTLLIGGVLGSLLLLIFGLGLVEIPNVKKLIEDLSSALGAWTYLVVGLMAFFETGAFVGLIAPGETFMLLGGVVAGQGQVSLVILIGIAWTCAVLGDVVSFYAGHRLGRDFLERHGPRFSITHERLATVDGFFNRHGGKAVFLGRFVGLVRAVNPFLAGSSGMPIRRFLPYSILGAGAWATTLLVLGYVFWQSFDRVVAWAERGALALGTTVSVLVAGIWTYRYFKVKENRDSFAAWTSRTLDRPALRPLAFVLRPVWRRTWALRRFIAGRLTPGDLGLEVTTLHATMAVGGFFFLGNAIELGKVDMIPGDTRAADFVVSIRTDWLTSIATIVTDLGSWSVLLPLVVLAIWFAVYRQLFLEAAVLAAGAITTALATSITKAMIDRPRPSGSLVETVGSSYPSGHSANGVAWLAVAVVIARAVPGLARPLLLIITGISISAAIALSRVYLGAHYISDVVGGLGLGVAIYSACALVAIFAGHVRQNRRNAREQ